VLRDANLKDLVDGRGRMTGRQIRQRHRAFQRTHKLFLYGNYDPCVVAADDGTWRRILKIPFARQFEKGARNVNLKEKLIACHLPEVLAWAVRGCVDWLRHGLRVPDSVSRATEELRREQDVVGRFLNERAVPHDGPGWTVGSVYAEYDRWRRTDGELALSKRELGAELRRRGYRQQHTTADGVHGRFWVGLRLR
jgi:putative DNA primase/helicase